VVAFVSQGGEPEIIPPGADWPPTPRGRVSNSARRVTFVRIARLGPAGIILSSLVLGMLAGLVFVLLLGLAVIGVAIAGLVIIGAAISFFLRRALSRVSAAAHDDQGRGVGPA
jgi:hypothetical protein